MVIVMIMDIILFPRMNTISEDQHVLEISKTHYEDLVMITFHITILEKHWSEANTKRLCLYN